MAETKSLYDLWILQSEDQSDAGRYQAFFEKYYELETEAYRKILSAMPETPYAFGTFQELQDALGFDREPVIFMGFLSGINDCLEIPNELEALTPESKVKLEIKFPELLYKMHKVKARWLYDLPEWEYALSEEERQTIAKQYHEDHTRRVDKIGRNEPCPCGSGKKYKKCCGK